MTYEELRKALGCDQLGTQAANCLWREYTWHGGTSEVAMDLLCSLTRDDLLDIRNFGPQSLARVESWLAREGRALRELA